MLVPYAHAVQRNGSLMITLNNDEGAREDHFIPFSYTLNPRIPSRAGVGPAHHLPLRAQPRYPLATLREGQGRGLGRPVRGGAAGSALAFAHACPGSRAHDPYRRTLRHPLRGL